MGDDRYGVDRTGLRPPGNQPTMVQAGLALAGVLAAVLLVAVSVLSTTATVNAASHPTIQAQQAGVPVVPSVNIFHYATKDHTPLAARDIRRLRALGVTQFQIDSVYEKFCRE